jgi:predicted secreted hydrolase
MTPFSFDYSRRLLQISLYLLLIFQSCVHHSMFNADWRYRRTIRPDLRIAPLPRNSLEWWYINAHLQDSNGREFAFHHAVFRRYTFPLRYLWMSSTALCDLANDTQYTHFRLYRNRDIYSRSSDDLLTLKSADFNMLTAIPGGKVTDSISTPLYAVEAVFEGGAAWIAQAPGAMLDMGRKRRAAYLSQPFLLGHALLHVDSSSFLLNGTAWYDRQWNALKLTRYPWNWISLEHDSFRLMLFAMEDKEAKDVFHIRGCITDRQGQTRYLTEADVLLAGSDIYTGSQSGNAYPLTWQLAIPAFDLQVSLKTRIRHGELPLHAMGYNFMTYWEGPCQAWGLYRGEVFHARAFLEMTRP